jgi:hypothetical protein
MKQSLFCFLSFLFFQCSFASDGIQPYKGKVYIFDSWEQAKRCDVLGNNVAGTATTMEKGAQFTVERVPDATHLVIRFLKWKNDNTKNTTYFKNTAALVGGSSDIFFLLSKAVFDASCSEFKKEQKWDIVFGSLTTPFKFRRDPFLFTTNLNLGTSVSYQRRISSNWSFGFIGGLSLSSISIDSFSTKGFITNVTERPAVTPSIHGMFGYKNINLTIGMGWDFINRPTAVEQRWLYHGKRWVGIGIGVNLFNAGNNEQGTKAQKQGN